jgi:hypothetical protein
MSGGISGPTAQIIDRELIKRIKAEFPNYHMHGGMYTHDNSLQVSLPTAGSPVVSTGWTAADSTGTGFIVVDAANGTITIGDKGAGRYQINANFSFSSTKANALIHGALYVDGVKQIRFTLKRKIGNANDIGNASFPSLTMVLSPGEVLDVRFESDINTTVLDIEHGGWGIIWMAGE